MNKTESIATPADNVSYSCANALMRWTKSAFSSLSGGTPEASCRNAPFGSGARVWFWEDPKGSRIAARSSEDCRT
jgi:hypothetical protein